MASGGEECSAPSHFNSHRASTRSCPKQVCNAKNLGTCDPQHLQDSPRDHKDHVILKRTCQLSLQQTAWRVSHTMSMGRTSFIKVDSGRLLGHGSQIFVSFVQEYLNMWESLSKDIGSRKQRIGECTLLDHS